MKVVVATANNYESFNAKTSYITANPLGVVNSVNIIHRFLVAKAGAPEDLLFSNLKKSKGPKRKIK